MTREEARQIKEEILKKEGSVYFGESLIVDRVVKTDDVLKIITEYTLEDEE